MNLATLANTVLTLARQFAPLIPGGAEGIAAADALGKLIGDVSPHATPATAAELTQLRADVNARLDATLNSLGDAPPPA